MVPWNWMQTCIAAALCSIAVDHWVQRKRGDLPLPPGPSPLPIVGNVPAINRKAPWLTYTEWAGIYGDLVYVRFFNQELVIVNSLEAARALFDKRSNIYSDRPQLPTYALFGLDFSTVFLPYGDKWRMHRWLYQQAFRPKVISRYRLIHQRKVEQMLMNVLEAPEDCYAHFQTYSSSVMMSSVYDYETEPREDPMVQLIERALKLATSSIRPEITAIFRVFPALLMLPSWVPGMDVLKKAAQSREYVKRWIEVPFQHTLKCIEEGTAGSSMVSEALRTKRDDVGYYTRAVKDASATAFGAGADTTSSLLRVFMLAMVLFPEVQEKAQREIDAVVGTWRLPGWDDRPSLKYIDAIIRETLRWHPIMSLALPHETTEQDIYQGFYIPKGATIVANVWAITRDEKRYPRPNHFVPERFLDENGDLTDDTVSYAFGFGRRICPGRYFADASLWWAVACMLATLTFAKATDANGEEIDFEPKWSSGIAIHPLPFPHKVIPRRLNFDVKELLS